MFDRVALVARLALVREHHLQTLLHRARGEVFVEPVHVLAHVGHAVVEPERLGYVHATALIEPEGDRVGEQRLRGPQLDLDALGDAEAQGRLASLLRGLVYEGRIVVLSVLLGEGCEYEQEREPGGALEVHERGGAGGGVREYTRVPRLRRAC